MVCRQRWRRFWKQQLWARCLFTAQWLCPDADDCDDNNADINPDSVWYIDLDGDGYGNSSFSFQQCAQPSNYVLDNTDCDDLEATTYIGANEICDGIDNDCDNLVDDDDSDLLITNTNVWYADTDNDGFGDSANSILSCNQPSGYVTNNTDCDDQSADAYPTAQEVCDGIDNDCDNLVDDDDPALSLSSASLWFLRRRQRRFWRWQRVPRTMQPAEWLCIQR